MENPFFYGRAVGGTAFVNRRDEIAQLSSDLARGQSVILFSPRRYGKTSLIKQVIKKLQARKIHCFYVDLYTVTSLDEFYGRYSTAIARSIRGPAEALISLLRDLLPLVKPKLSYSEPGAPTIEIEAGLPTLRKGPTLRELFESVERFCTKKSCRAVVVFDEFQEITSLENGDQLEREMRAAFQHHTQVGYAFLGSKMHLMNELFKDTNRPFYNFGKRIELEVIKPAAWRNDIARKFKAGGYVIDKETIDTITGFTRGHPYYTQLLCSEIWDRFTAGIKFGRTDITEIVRSAVEKENHAFQELWDSLSRAQRKVVSVLALYPETEMFSAETLRTHNLGAASAVSRTLEQLMKRGIVLKRDRRFSVTDPFVTHWISLRN